jgi:hypothetical protein
MYPYILVILTIVIILLLSRIYRITNKLKSKYEENKEFVPPGHFYSAIPDLETKKNFRNNWDNRRKGLNLLGIDLSDDQMNKHFMRVVKAGAGTQFPDEKSDGWRYYFKNTAYSYSDALSLHAMLINIQPKRLIEVGSGFSSAMILDTNEKFLDYNIDLTFIEPFPELLKSLMKKVDNENCKILPNKVQDIPHGVFLPYAKEIFYSLTLHMFPKLTVM